MQLMRGFKHRFPHMAPLIWSTWFEDTWPNTHQSYLPAHTPVLIFQWLPLQFAPHLPQVRSLNFILNQSLCLLFCPSPTLWLDVTPLVSPRPAVLSCQRFLWVLTCLTFPLRNLPVWQVLLKILFHGYDFDSWQNMLKYFNLLCVLTSVCISLLAWIF